MLTEETQVSQPAATDICPGCNQVPQEYEESGDCLACWNESQRLLDEVAQVLRFAEDYGVDDPRQAVWLIVAILFADKKHGRDQDSRSFSAKFNRLLELNFALDGMVGATL